MRSFAPSSKRVAIANRNASRRVLPGRAKRDESRRKAGFLFWGGSAWDGSGQAHKRRDRGKPRRRSSFPFLRRRHHTPSRRTSAVQCRYGVAARDADRRPVAAPGQSAGPTMPQSTPTSKDRETVRTQSRRAALAAPRRAQAGSRPRRARAILPKGCSWHPRFWRQIRALALILRTEASWARRHRGPVQFTRAAGLGCGVVE